MKLLQKNQQNKLKRSCRFPKSTLSLKMHLPRTHKQLMLKNLTDELIKDYYKKFLSATKKIDFEGEKNEGEVDDESFIQTTDTEIFA